MERENFLSIKNIRAEIVYRKVNTNKERVEWLNIRWIQLRKEKPFEIRYRYSHNALEAWKILDVQRKRAGRPADRGRIPLVRLYTNPCPINTIISIILYPNSYFEASSTSKAYDSWKLIVGCKQPQTRQMYNTNAEEADMRICHH